MGAIGFSYDNIYIYSIGSIKLMNNDLYDVTEEKIYIIFDTAIHTLEELSAHQYYDIYHI